MLGLAEAGQVGVDDGGQGALVAEVDLDLAEILTLLKQMGRVRVAQRVRVRGLFDSAGTEGDAEGALEGAAGHRFSGRAGALATTAFGGKEQDRMTMGFPLLAQEEQGALRQWDVAVLITFAAADVEEHALGIDVADLEIQTFPETEPAGVEGDEADAMVQSWDHGQDPAHFGSGEDDGEFELGIGAG